jgi:hypothetical protein
MEASRFTEEQIIGNSLRVAQQLFDRMAGLIMHPLDGDVVEALGRVGHQFGYPMAI